MREGMTDFYTINKSPIFFQTNEHRILKKYNGGTDKFGAYLKNLSTANKMVRRKSTSDKLFFKRIIFDTRLTLGFIAIEMTTRETSNLFSISFGWSTILQYLSYIDIYNISAYTNQQLTTAILQAIGDKTNEDEKENKNQPLITTKIEEYARKAFLSTFERYLCHFGLTTRSFLQEVYRFKGILCGEFVLSIYTGFLYLNTDINIFIPKWKTVVAFKIEMIRLKSLIDYIVDHSNYEFMTYRRERNHSEITVITFINKTLNRKIQVIVSYGCEDIVNYPFKVISNFDLTITMCFIILTAVQTIQFVCTYKSHVLNKTMQFNKSAPLTIQVAQKAVERIINFQDKGYKFMNGDVNFENFWQHEIQLSKSKRK